MTKTKRMIEQNLKLCDVLCEIVDARIPVSSRNPDLQSLAAGKPRLLILNRSDQADPAETAVWITLLKKENQAVLETDSKAGKGVERFAQAVRLAAASKLERAKEKGQTPTLRVMVVGIPNVGKSSLINRITKSNRAKAEDRPGVTRGQQWFTVDKQLELLDTPGILWPKIEDQRTARMLAFTGAIKDQIMDVEGLAVSLLDLFVRLYPAKLEERYKVPAEGTGLSLLQAIARKRGALLAGGEPDLFRMSNLLLDELRSGKLGRITLEPAPRGSDA